MSSLKFVKRTKEFAIECISLADDLPDSKLGNHIHGQLMRSATSVAANYRATRLAQSRAAFIAKLSIVIEEVDEAEFWIDFAISLGLLEQVKALPIQKEANEIASIFITSRKTMQTSNS